MQKHKMICYRCAVFDTKSSNKCAQLSFKFLLNCSLHKRKASAFTSFIDEETN